MNKIWHFYLNLEFYSQTKYDLLWKIYWKPCFTKFWILISEYWKLQTQTHTKSIVFITELEKTCKTCIWTYIIYMLKIHMWIYIIYNIEMYIKYTFEYAYIFIIAPVHTLLFRVREEARCYECGMGYKRTDQLYCLHLILSTKCWTKSAGTSTCKQHRWALSDFAML